MASCSSYRLAIQGSERLLKASWQLGPRLEVKERREAMLGLGGGLAGCEQLEQMGSSCLQLRSCLPESSPAQVLADIHQRFECLECPLIEARRPGPRGVDAVDDCRRVIKRNHIDYVGLGIGCHHEVELRPVAVLDKEPPVAPHVTDRALVMADYLAHLAGPTKEPTYEVGLLARRYTDGQVKIGEGIAIAPHDRTADTEPGDGLLRGTEVAQGFK